MTTSPDEVRLERCGLRKAVEARPAGKSLFHRSAAVIPITAARDNATTKSGLRDLLGCSAGVRAALEVGSLEATRFEELGAAAGGLATFCWSESLRVRWLRPELVSRLRRRRSVCRSAALR